MLIYLVIVIFNSHCSAIKLFVLDGLTQCHTLPICKYVHVHMAIYPYMYTNMSLESTLAYEDWLMWVGCLFLSKVWVQMVFCMFWFFKDNHNFIMMIWT